MARFCHSGAVGAYLGLRPRQRDSGAATPQLRISKAGDAMVRKFLTARKLAVLLHRLLVTGAAYVPLRDAPRAAVS